MKKILKILFIGIFAMSISTGCVDKYKDTKKEVENNILEDNSQDISKKWISTKDIDSIKLNNLRGNVKIYYHNDDKILIKGDLKDKYQFNTENNILDITSKVEEASDYWITVYLPRKEYKSILIENKDASTKVFNVEVENLIINSNDEIVVDSVKAVNLNLYTEDKKVVITKDNIDKAVIETKNNTNIIVDETRATSIHMTTDNGNIYARIIGDKNDYQVNYGENGDKVQEKQITAISNTGQVEVKFM